MRLAELVMGAGNGPGHPTEMIIREGPPAPRREVMRERERPSPRHVWIAGYWAWREGRHAWMAGHWGLPPREHAVWALADYGFRVVIATSFADIFANNSLKNGLLTVRLGEEQVAEITRRSKEIEGYQLTIDLETLRVEDGRGLAAAFAMDEFSRHCLLNGLDDIGLTLQHEAEIAAYEAKHPVRGAMKAILAG